MKLIHFSRVLTIWIIAIVIVFLVLNKNNNSSYLRYGPNNDLVIIGIKINNVFKYTLLVFLIIINIIMRNINNEIIRPWIILNIQNTVQQIENKKECYEISIVSNFYVWFDWFCSLILLFSQIDICLIDIFVDLLSTIILTRYYLKQKENIIQPFLN